MPSVSYIGDDMPVNMIYASLLFDMLKFLKGEFTQTITINLAVALMCHFAGTA